MPGRRPVRGRKPTQAMRTRRYTSGGTLRATLWKTSPRLKKREGDAERDEPEQVERPERQRSAEIRETEHEERREPHPDGPGGEHLAAERSGPPARHLPRDLRARPRLGDASGRVGHDPARDLSRVARPDVHRPRPAPPVERPVGDGEPRVALEPVGDLRLGEHGGDRRALGQPRRGTARRARLGGRVEGSASRSRPPVPGARERGAPRRARASARPGSAAARSVDLPPVTERPELVADEVHGRDEDDRDRLRDELLDPGADEQVEHERGSPRGRAPRRRRSGAPAGRRRPAGAGTSRGGSRGSCS